MNYFQLINKLLIEYSDSLSSCPITSVGGPPIPPRWWVWPTTGRGPSPNDNFVISSPLVNDQNLTSFSSPAIKKGGGAKILTTPTYWQLESFPVCPLKS